MLKVITYLVGFLLTFDFNKTKKIVNIVFNKEEVIETKTKTMVNNRVMSRSIPKKTTPVVNTEKVVKPVTKQEELENSLKELKAKKNKTTKDKDTIGVIEAILKNYNKNLN